MFLTLYKTLVRPVLEYSSPVWSPQKKKYIKIVECVQRRTTKLLGHIRDLPYPDRLKYSVLKHWNIEETVQT